MEEGMEAPTGIEPVIKVLQTGVVSKSNLK